MKRFLHWLLFRNRTEPQSTWFFCGLEYPDYAFGEGDWPITALRGCYLSEMKWNASNGWIELQKPPRLLARLFVGDVLYNIMKAEGSYFVWGFTSATHGFNGDPYPDAAHYWIEHDKMVDLFDLIKDYRDG